ncbi:MAG: sulfurtransferase TusA family protein [Fibrobacter sp.]|nr:sulfurtransferase TusA family protein [Fibrobacter sp.]
MPELFPDNPIARWIATNEKTANFDEKLQFLLAFACSDWIRRGSGVILPSEAALAKVVAAGLERFPLGDWLDSPRENAKKIADFCEKIKILSLPDCLKQEFPHVLDLRGVVCPKNAARSRLVMAGLPEGFRLDILLDEGAPIENVPQALVADGHFIENRHKKADFWVLTVVKCK